MLKTITYLLRIFFLSALLLLSIPMVFSQNEFAEDLTLKSKSLLDIGSHLSTNEELNPEQALERLKELDALNSSKHKTVELKREHHWLLISKNDLLDCDFQLISLSSTPTKRSVLYGFNSGEAPVRITIDGIKDLANQKDQNPNNGLPLNLANYTYDNYLIFVEPSAFTQFLNPKIENFTSYDQSRVFNSGKNGFFYGFHLVLAITFLTAYYFRKGEIILLFSTVNFIYFFIGTMTQSSAIHYIFSLSNIGLTKINVASNLLLYSLGLWFICAFIFRKVSEPIFIRKMRMWLFSACLIFIPMILIFTSTEESVNLAKKVSFVLLGVSVLLLLVIGRKVIFSSRFSMLLLVVIGLQLVNNFAAYTFSGHLYNYLFVSQVLGFFFVVVVGLTLRALEEKNIDLQLAEYQTEINTQKQLTLAKNQFLSNISHELRTPLNAILGFSNLLTQESLKPKHLENIQSIHDSGNQLLGIVNNILDYSKLESGELKLSLNEFDPKNELHQIVHSTKSIARSRDLLFNYSLPENLPNRFIGDPFRLQQMINNVFDNSVKFTPQGKVSLNVEYEKSGPHLGKLTITISDSGIGIPKSRLDYIHHAFITRDESTTRKYSGTGIGLSIVHHLIGLHKGEMHIESTENEGTTVVLQIPYALPQTDSKIVLKSQPEQKSIEGKRILIVEDNLINQMVAKQVLEKWGAEIEVAEDGDIGISMLSQTHFDLVLMDLMMPNMDGYEATTIIRDVNSKVLDHNIPIVALTADVLEGTRERVIKLGMNAYISKPFKQEELYATLKKFLG